MSFSSGRVSTRFLSFLAAVVCGILFTLALILVGSVRAAGNGTIAGYVSDASSGLPLANVNVQAYGGTCSPSCNAWTNATGNYTITGLVTGSYNVSFSDNHHQPLSLSAQVFSDTVATLNATLSLSGTNPTTNTYQGIIYGYVTANGSPVEVNVNLHGQNSWWPEWRYAYGGTFSFENLPPDTYIISISDNRYRTITQTIVINQNTPPQSLNIVLTPVQPGSIDGYVTDMQGNPLSGIEVRGYFTSNVTITTNSAGYYLIPSVLPGDNISLRFVDPTGTYAAVNNWGVQVFEGTKTTINTQMPRAGAISGKVTSKSGTPIPNIRVQTGLFDDYHQSMTQADGTYLLKGLSSGPHDVSFSDDTGTYRSTSPYSVTVTEGVTTPNIDQVLVQWAGIEGVVKNQDGSPVHNLSLSARRLDNNLWGNGWTSLGGTYRISYLEPGTYEVMIFFNGQTYTNTAQVIEEQTTKNVNFTIHVNVGSVQGVVTDESNQPIAGVDVSASGPSSKKLAVTNNNGYYHIPGLFQQQGYTIEFQHPNYAYYSRSITITSNMSATVNAQLRALIPNQIFGGTISGTVKNGMGQPLAGITVIAEQMDMSPWGTWSNWWYKSTTTNANGIYELAGLAIGNTYVVKFQDPNGVYIEQYCNNQSKVETAQRFTIQANDKLSAHAILAKGASIKGKLNNPPLWGGVDVFIYDTFNQQWLWRKQATVDSSTGNYAIGGLTNGIYRLGFYGTTKDNSSFNEFYNVADKDVWEIAQADTISLGIEEQKTLGPLTFGPNSGPMPVDLFVSKYSDRWWNSKVQPNETVNYTINYGNQWGGIAQNVILTDTLPAGMTYIGQSNDQNIGPTYNQQSRTLVRRGS